MATIRPSADIRNHYTEISDFCNNNDEPVFITKNGTGDLVVLSNSYYERMCAKFEFQKLLLEGLKDIGDDSGRRTIDDVFFDFGRKFGFGGL